jgi:hypothetical protein
MRHIFWSLPLFLLAGCALSVEHPPTVDSSVVSVTAENPEEQEKATRIDPTRKLPDNAGMVRLAKTDPIAFLADTIRRYDRDVRGYTCTLIKQERVGGKLHPQETIASKFREKPFSVLMDWKEGIGLAKKTLYVAGENDGKLLAMPAGWRRIAGIQSRDVKSADAMKTSRFPITEFGLKKGVVAALVPWKKAKKRGDLKVVYGGVKRLPELNKRPCWELKRVGYPRPEDDGVTEATFYFDTENWLMIGTILRGEEGQLIAKYFFRDVELNPEFDEDTFTRKALRN